MANVQYRASLLFKTGYNIYTGRINVNQAESIVVSPVSLNVSTGSSYDINCRWLYLICRNNAAPVFELDSISQNSDHF